MKKTQFYFLSCCLSFLFYSGMTYSTPTSEPINLVSIESQNEIGVARPVEAIPVYNDNFTPDIVGGGESPLGARPYQVQLRLNGSHWCGGALLNQQWVLTAAHCMTSGLSVRVGVRDISSNEGQVINIAEQIVHPSFNGSVGNGYDIALLKLASNAPSSLTPITLPTQSIMDTGGSPGDVVTVSGWGDLSEGGNGPSILHEVDVPIVSNQTCNSPQAYGGGIKDDMICAGLSQGGKDSCQGDSGGPLATQIDGTFYSIGIVSWGEGCARPNKYGVYVRTFAYVDWINSHTGGGSSSGGSSSGGSSSGGSSSGGNELQNGVPVSGLSASTGNDVVYTINVPSGASNLVIKIAGGSGDADLYTRAGSAPTDSTYECRPYINGNNETCTEPSPSSGIWYARVKAYSSFSNVTLTASYDGGGSSSGGSSSGGSSSGGSSGGNELQNGVPVSGLSASTGNDVVYTIDVPSGASNLVIKIQGGSGDADLYTRAGSAPTDSTYECRPYINGNNETCTEPNPTPGVWYARVKAYSSFSNVTLTASFDGGGSSSGGSSSGGSSSGGNELQNGVPVGGLSASTGNDVVYTIDVPNGASNLVIKIQGGSGDADLYTRAGATPTDSNYECRPYINGNNETCTKPNPSPGTWYARVKAYSSFSNVTLTASYSP